MQSLWSLVGGPIAKVQDRGRGLCLPGIVGLRGGESGGISVLQD